jgi:hypothetical protein
VSIASWDYESEPDVSTAMVQAIMSCCIICVLDKLFIKTIATKFGVTHLGMFY